MKKFCKVFLGLLAILLLNFAFPLQGWAHTGTHYGKVTVTASGGGQVYISENQGASSGTGEATWNCGGEDKDSKTYYLFANPDAAEHYYFEGWYLNGENKGTNSPYTATHSASGSQQSPTTFTYTAKFESLPKFYFAARAEVDAAGNGTGKVDVAYTSTEPDASNFSADPVSAKTAVWAETKDDDSKKATAYYFAKADAGMTFMGWYDETGVQKSTDNPYSVSQTSTTQEDNATPEVYYARFRDPSIKFDPAVELAGQDGATELTLKIEETQVVSFVNVDDAVLSTLNAPTINIVNRVDPGSDPIVIWDATNRKLTANRAGTATVTFSHPTTDDFNAADFTFTIHVEKYDPTFSWKTSTLFIQEYGFEDLIETTSDGAWSLESNKESVFASLSLVGTTRTTPSSTGSVTLTFSQSASYKYNAISAQSQELKVYDASALATFSVNNVAYNTLAEAITASIAGGKKYTILVTGDGMVIPGTYTIPSGVTLLVPYDDAGTVSTTTCATSDDQTTPSLFRKLTLPAGTTLNIEGALCVNSAGIANNGGGKMVKMHGEYGQITMEYGSVINIESGANLYAWGFIIGEGDVHVKSGAKIYEALQFDLRGAKHILAVNGKVLPLNQYHVQNVESPLTIYSGASETLFTIAKSMKKSLDFIMTYDGSTQNALFLLKTGSKIVRRYEGAADRMRYDIYGNAILSNISVSIAGYGCDSKNSVLPITNNMTVGTHSGTVEIKYAVELLPGARLEIYEDAVIDAKSNVFVYDRDEWIGKKCALTEDLNPVPYAPGRTYSSATSSSRTAANMEDASMMINGELKMSTGGFYTTTGKANVYSSVGGKIALTAGAGSKTSTPQNVSTSQKTQDIPITPAKLHNADDTYTPTSGAPARSTFTYINGMWVRPEGICAEVYIGANGDKYITYQGNWVKVTRDGSTCDYIDEPENKYRYNDNNSEWVKVFDLKWDANGGTFETSEETIVEPLEEGATITAPANPTREGYTFAGWDQEIPSTMPAEDMTITANWSINQYTIRFENEGGALLQSVDVEHGQTPAYTGATPTKAATAQYSYTFKGWSPAIAAATENATYTATFASTTNKYTITWTDENDVVLGTDEVDYGVMPTHVDLTKTATAEYTYTFNGWYPTLAAVTDAATYKSLGFTATPKSYTLTWNLDGGNITTAGTTAGSVEWGTSLTAPTVEKKGYTFNGWTPSVPATMPAADATYTAQWTAVPTTAKYYVKHYKLHIKSGEKFTEPFWDEESEEVAIGTEVTPDFKEIEGYDNPAKDTTITIRANPNENVVIYEYPISETNTLEVENDTKTINDSTEAYTVMLAPGKTMNITETGSVTAKNLVLQSKPGDNLGANLLTTTNLEILGDVCIEIDMNNSGTMNDKLFYCFSVPFNVNVDDGVKRLNETNGNWESAELNTNYRVYTYDEADRAINGRQDSNWKEFNGTQFLPGVFYLCEFDNSNYNRYRFYAADKTNLNNKGNIAVSNTGDETNGGWNGVANNGLTDNKLSGDFKLIQTLNSVKNSFESAEASKKPLAIGNAAMVQVSKEGSVVVGETPSTVAARRMGETASTEFINVRLYKENQDQHVDQIFIRASEDAAEQYVAGIDLSKATMGTPKVARMWVNDYDLQLVANEALMTNDQAIFSLGMSAPANGEYIIALNETPADAIVYLTMDGSAIWNLNIAPAPISLSKGTEDSYGLRLVRKINNVVTGLDEAVLNGDVQKVILNDHLYIIRDGKVYSAHGHVIK